MHWCSQEVLSEDGSRESTFSCKKAHVLLITSTKPLAELMTLKLGQENYQVNVVRDGMSGLMAARQEKPDLIVIDWSSCFLALNICERLRSIDQRLPILVTTATRKTSDRIKALDAGADDCFSQPLIMAEFLAKLRAHLRRNQAKDSPVLTFSDLRLNLQTREVYRGGRLMSLTAKEFDLLTYFMAHPKQVLTRYQILERIWGCDFLGNSNVIEVYVRYLRLKLETNNNKRLIYTVRRVGYVLRAMP